MYLPLCIFKCAEIRTEKMKENSFTNFTYLHCAEINKSSILLIVLINTANRYKQEILLNNKY